MVDSFKSFVERWNTPALYTVLLGGIIWGVQLNFAVLELTEQMASQSKAIRDLEEEVYSAAVINARTSALLDALVDQVKALETRMTRNESWIRENADIEN